MLSRPLPLVLAVNRRPRQLNHRARRHFAVLFVMLTVVTSAVIVPRPAPVAAYQGDPGIPLTWAGGGAAGTAVGTLVMAPAAIGSLGAGTAIVAFPGTTAAAGLASFGAGFALGYYGMKGICWASGESSTPVKSIETQGIDSQICGQSYEFQSDQPAGVEVTGFTSDCPSNVSTGRLCSVVSWDELTDYGQGNGTPVLELVDKKGDPVRMNNRFTGCATNEQNVAPGVLQITTTSSNSTACPRGGITGMVGTTPAPYGPGSATAITSSGWGSFTAGFANGPFVPGDRWRVRLMKNGVIDRDRVLADVPANPEANDRGRPIRARVTAQCWVAPSWNITSVAVTGEWFPESSPGDVAPTGNPCPAGSIVKEFDYQHQWDDRNGVRQTSTVITWDAPPEWDPTVVTEFDEKHQECIRKGQGCKLGVVTDVADPDLGECKWGDDVVLASYCTEPAPTVIEDPWEVTQSTTTTVATTTTTPGTTTTVPDESVPPADPPPPPAPPEDGDSQWGTCMESQVDSDWGDITFNPVTWVRAIIYYVTAPIICALWWLFVPPDGWGPLWEDFQALWNDNELVAPLRSFFGLFDDVGVSSCAPVQMGNPFGVVPIGDVSLGWCENAVITLVFVVFMGLGCLGMAADLIKTVASLGAFRSSLGSTGGAGADTSSGDGDGDSGGGLIGSGHNYVTGSWEDYGVGGQFT